jgi:hypothetical protein
LGEPPRKNQQPAFFDPVKLAGAVGIDVDRALVILIGDFVRV